MDLALTLTIVGMGVVFAALVILAFTISLLSKAVNLNKNTEKPANVASNTVNADTISNEISTNNEVSANNENDEQLVAVITAAIMASMKHNPDFKIRIKSFRRIPDSSPAWNTAGKLATVNANVR
jgi:sodium pump decarboxylase gamma subunit